MPPWIGVTTAGEVDAAAAAFAERCAAALAGFEVRRLDPIPDPAYAWDASRRQYSSTLIMRDALARMPAEALKLFVLTERDLFIPMLSFVYGQAQLAGPVALLSFARLRQEFYGLPSSEPLFLQRIRKETCHELGHAFGLTHCSDRLCAMALSTGIEQLDLKGGRLCSGCEVLLRDAAAAASRATPRA